MKNHIPDVIVIVPNGVQAGHAERYVDIEPSGEVLQLVMEEPMMFKNLVQVGKRTGAPVRSDTIDELRSDAAIVSALDSTDGPILVSDTVLDYMRSDWRHQSDELLSRVFAPFTGPTTLRDEQGRIVAVTQLRSAHEPGFCDKLADGRKPGKRNDKTEVGSACVLDGPRAC